MSAGSLQRTTLGPYRLAGFLGAGGMGEVYRAVEVQTGRVVALKVLVQTARGGDQANRFRDEARIQSAMKHPAIAELHEYFEVDGLPCIAMEFVDGDTLDAVLRRRGPLPAQEALRLFADIVDAVGYLHQRGVIHRDIKSTNVKLTESGGVKLLDFGIAKSAGSPKLTATGSVVGTLHYLSPEQLRTGVAEARSDIWSLGVLLYELVTGRLPFDGDGLGILTERILRGVFRPASAAAGGSSRDVDRIIGRCLTVGLDGRYASAEALLTDVRQCLARDVPRPAVLAEDIRALQRHSGELLLAARRHGPLVASASVAGVAVIFLLHTLLATPTPRQPASGDTASVVERVPAIAARGAADALGPAEGERAQGGTHRVLLDVFEGSADVELAGRRLGATPVPITARLHDSVFVTLRQRGFVDTTVMVEFTENRHAHTVRMRALTDPDGQI
ncbi:MAG: Serine/threonine-protein kinase PknD [Gemmatimonadaceae bacterium]|nr:Serine/threonine-protein kinase PknD [Gemmatimonadaceae bacterium]